ncbi:MAG: hypothetical protein AAF318_11120 [Pseudomonadota bacterium]
MLVLACGGLSGCLSLGDETRPALMAAQNGPPQTVGLLTVLGEDAQTAAFAAQSEALRAQEAGVPVTWQGGRARGSVTPGPVHSVNTQVCRDVTHQAQKDRQQLRGRLTLCQNADGAWEPLS